MKAVQKFSREYLEHCRAMTPEQILQFLEAFRLMHGSKDRSGKSKLISLKVPKPLLATFKTQCQMLQIPYQTQIKNLMSEWLRTK